MAVPRVSVQAVLDILTISNGAAENGTLPIPIDVDLPILMSVIVPDTVNKQAILRKLKSKAGDRTTNHATLIVTLQVSSTWLVWRSACSALNHMAVTVLIQNCILSCFSSVPFILFVCLATRLYLI
jgi:hypothetical protein